MPNDGAGVLEVVGDFDGNTYRAVYTVKFAGVIYVLHAFQKKSARNAAARYQLDKAEAQNGRTTLPNELPKGRLEPCLIPDRHIVKLKRTIMAHNKVTRSSGTFLPIWPAKRIRA